MAIIPNDRPDSVTDTNNSRIPNILDSLNKIQEIIVVNIMKSDVSVPEIKVPVSPLFLFLFSPVSFNT